MVAFGDSVTAGTGSTLDANNRYPDFLARRLLTIPPRGRASRQMSVLNAGIGGNRILHDAPTGIEQLGLKLVARFDRDVFAQTGVTDVILLAGSRCFTEAGEAKRQAVNQWIRTSREFDGVIDFDAALRDPFNPSRLRPELNSGDWLHPNDTGYEVMARAVDLSLFASAVADGARAR